MIYSCPHHAEALCAAAEGQAPGQRRCALGNALHISGHQAVSSMGGGCHQSGNSAAGGSQGGLLCAVQYSDFLQNTVCAPQMWLLAPCLFAIWPLAFGPQSLCTISSDRGVYRKPRCSVCCMCLEGAILRSRGIRTEPVFCLLCAQKVAIIEAGLFDSGEQEGALQVSSKCHKSPVHNCICHML